MPEQDGQLLPPDFYEYVSILFEHATLYRSVLLWSKQFFEMNEKVRVGNQNYKINAFGQPVDNVFKKKIFFFKVGGGLF